MSPAALLKAVPSAGVATGRISIARPLLPAAEHIFPYLQRIDASRHYSNFGPLVGELEERLANQIKGSAVCTVSNATQGLALLLRALAPSPGLCIVPGFTFVATAHAAIQAGHVPYLADVDPTSWMLTPETARQALREAGETVRAIVVVCAFGAMPDVEGFLALQAETGIPVILDAAAAFGSLATAALPAVVSLHATKVLGAGEGGYVVSNDEAIIAKVRQLSSFGFAGSRRSHMAASNAKISEYSAAVALAALDSWPVSYMHWMLRARKLTLAARACATFQAGWGENWISSTCVARVADDAAETIAGRLAELDIETRDWWGLGLHQEPAFRDCPRSSLANVDRLAGSTIGLPFFVDMASEELDRVAYALHQAVSQA